MKAYFKVLCAKQNLQKIRHFVRDKLGDMNIHNPIQNQLVLAVDEACANSIIHQHHCDGKSFLEIRIYKIGHKLLIELKDKGTAFPIDKAPEANIHDMVKNRIKGGLGIYLIHTIMDEIEVIQQEDNFTYRFIKNLPAA